MVGLGRYSVESGVGFDRTLGRSEAPMGSGKRLCPRTRFFDSPSVVPSKTPTPTDSIARGLTSDFSIQERSRSTRFRTPAATVPVSRCLQATTAPSHGQDPGREHEDGCDQRHCRSNVQRGYSPGEGGRHGRRTRHSVQSE